MIYIVVKDPPAHIPCPFSKCGKGLQHDAKFVFKLYPNPTTGDITEVTLPQNKEGELRTYSMYGSQLGTYPLQDGYNKVLIPASRWSPGTALVVLMIEGRQVVAEKVVKSR